MVTSLTLKIKQSGNLKVRKTAIYEINVVSDLNNSLTNTAGVTTLTVSMSYTPFSASLCTFSCTIVSPLDWKPL